MDTQIPLSLVAQVVTGVITIASAIVAAVWLHSKALAKRNDELVDRLMAHKRDTKNTAELLPKLRHILSEVTNVPSIPPPSSFDPRDDDRDSEHALVLNDEQRAEIRRMLEEYSKGQG